VIVYVVFKVSWFVIVYVVFKVRWFVIVYVAFKVRWVVIVYVVFKVRWVVILPFETVGNHHIHFQFIELVILVVIKAVTILPQKLDIFVDHLG
jgi:hypothetical protein